MSIKDPVKRMKSQNAEWEKIFANHLPNKGLASRVFKEFSKHNTDPLNST